MGFITDEYEKAENKEQFIQSVREELHKLSEHKDPIDLVRWIPIEKVVANDYNPNAVAHNEMKLLYTSIHHDGYTQPVVTVYDEEQDLYVIVDGFHRYLITRNYKDIADRNDGKLPCVVIEKSITERMASTVRHNRARGKHSVAGMSDMVLSMLEQGMADEDICKEIGLEADELLRLKHVTGFSKLFENVEYQKAWQTRHQIKLRRDYEQGS